MRLTLKEFRKREGLENQEDFDKYIRDIICDRLPCVALCEDGCEVEPDGQCEHGMPSILRVLRLI